MKQFPAFIAYILYKVYKFYVVIFTLNTHDIFVTHQWSYLLQIPQLLSNPKTHLDLNINSPMSVRILYSAKTFVSLKHK